MEAKLCGSRKKKFAPFSCGNEMIKDYVLMVMHSDSLQHEKEHRDYVSLTFFLLFFIKF